VTRRRLFGLGSLAFGVCALALVFTAPPVRAEAPSQTAWWFELQSKSLPAPLPNVPVVPDGGLYVQQGPNGPSAYGALHYTASDASKATLTLIAASGSTTSLGAPVQACVTSTKWTTPKQEPGAWEDAPKYGNPCTPGKIASDGSAVAFLFDSQFFKNGELDVAIVPTDGAPPFSLAFNKPSDQSLALTAAPSAHPSSSGSSTPETHLAGASTPSHATRAATAAHPAAPTAPAVAAAPAPAASSTPSRVADAVLNVAGLGDPDRGERAVALAGASAIVVGWWLLSTRAVRMPRLLGAMAGGGEAVATAPKVHVAGVGRFARGRTSAARHLR